MDLPNIIAITNSEKFQVQLFNFFSATTLPYHMRFLLVPLLFLQKFIQGVSSTRAPHERYLTREAAAHRAHSAALQRVRLPPPLACC